MRPMRRAASRISQPLVRLVLPVAIAVLLELSPLIAVAVVLKVFWGP
jgi:hypothetical protein